MIEQSHLRGSTANPGRWLVVAFLATGILAIFVRRTLLAQAGDPPRLFDLFNLLTLLASCAVLAINARWLKRRDLVLGAGLATLMGALVSLSSFYPLVRLGAPRWTSLGHGAALAIVFLAGLAIMRRGGPVTVRIASGPYPAALKSLAFGALIGLPLAGINAYAFSVMEGSPIAWEDPLGAALDALQPGVVEEVVYRLAFLGFLWLVLRHWWPVKAASLAAVFSLFVHNYAHFDQLFLEHPLFALGYGAVVGVLFGLPMTWLALRRDLETAIGLHWIVDFLRFAAGF